MLLWILMLSYLFHCLTHPARWGQLQNQSFYEFESFLLTIPEVFKKEEKNEKKQHPTISEH